MTKVDREIRDRIEAEVAHFSNARVRFCDGRHKTRVAELTIEDAVSGPITHKVFYSPGDNNRVVPNIVAQVRRELKQHGGLERQRRSHPPARHKRAPSRTDRDDRHDRNESRVGSLGELLMAARHDLNPLCPDDAVEIIRAQKPINGHGNGQGMNGRSNGHINGHGPQPMTVSSIPRQVLAMPKATPPVAQQAPRVEPQAEPIRLVADGPASKKKVQLGHEHVVQLTQLLITHGKSDKTAEPATYKYADGWSDERIRDQVHAGAKVDRIAELRRQHFGMLVEEIEQKNAVGDARGFAARVMVLEQQLKDAFLRIADLEKIVAPLKD
jgi:hypothetical protein